MEDETPTLDNQRAVDRDRLEAFKRAGIGRHFHDASLTDYGQVGEALKARMLASLFREFSGGLNFLVSGKKSRDLCVTFGRALLLSRFNVRVTSPTKLAALFDDKRYDILEEMREVKGLVILGFNDPGESPFTPWLRHRVEGLLQDRLDERRAIIAQVHHPKTLSWWSGAFAGNLSERVEQIEVKS